jgi:hypothetical protein
MKFDDRLVYRQSIHALLAAVTDAAAFEAVQRHLGSTNVRVLEQRSGGQFSIVLRYDEQSEAPIPAFAKKIVGQTSTVTECTTWDPVAGNGQTRVEVRGVPAKIRCTLTAAEDGSGCVVSRAWSLNVQLPLIGGKIEKLIAEKILAKVDREQAAWAEQAAARGRAGARERAASRAPDRDRIRWAPP